MEVARVGSSKKVSFPQLMAMLAISTCHLELSPALGNGGLELSPWAGPGHDTECSQQTLASNSLTQVLTPGWAPRPFPVSTCQHLSGGPWGRHFSHLCLSLKTSDGPASWPLGACSLSLLGAAVAPSRPHPGSYRGCSRRFSPPPLGSLRVPLAGGPCRCPRHQLCILLPPPEAERPGCVMIPPAEGAHGRFPCRRRWPSSTTHGAWPSGARWSTLLLL